MTAAATHFRDDAHRQRANHSSVTRRRSILHMGDGTRRVTGRAGGGRPRTLGLEGRGDLLARALRNQSLWLVIAYIGLLLLIARGYA